jgi:hypothetical protein
MGFLQFWPLPNNVGGPTYSANGTNDFYCNQSGQSNQYWGMDLRLDHNFSSRNRFYASMHRFDRNNQDYNIFQNAVSGDSWKIHPRGGVIDDVEVISPSFVMDVRLGFDDYDKLVTSLGSIPLTWRYRPTHKESPDSPSWIGISILPSSACPPSAPRDTPGLLRERT